MRIAKVEIDNFLCFKRLVMPVDPSLHLLAGPNNAGKSSFVRLLEAFFGNPSGEALSEMLPRHDYYVEAGGRILSSIKVWFSELAPDEITAAGAAYRRDRMIWVALRCSRAGNRSFEASKVRPEEAHRLYEYVLDRHHFVKIPSVRVGGAGDPDQPASLERLLDTLEAILIRKTAGRSTATQREFSQKAESLEAVVKEVLDQSADSIREDLPFQGGNVSFTLPEFRFALRGMLQAAQIESVDGARVPVAERGTGFQSALVLGILRYVASKESQGAGNVVFAVEEPEAFLHPQTQRAMTRILKKIAQDSQVVVTTHSPVVVDTFSLPQIARLPLEPQGTDFVWAVPAMSDAQEGRLSRYCTAGNSELVFANAVIFVEGEGDHAVVEYLLGRVCNEAGGHYARGVTVIDAGGLSKAKHLVALAEHFGVRSFVLADRDGLRARDGKRVLLDVLGARRTPPDRVAVEAVKTVADEACPDYATALTHHLAVNELLNHHGAYIMVSDLEGLLVDAFGPERIIDVLGPTGEGEIDGQFIATEIDGQPTRD